MIDEKALKFAHQFRTHLHMLVAFYGEDQTKKQNVDLVAAA